MNFKINFPTGYQVKDINVDNIDINIITENGSVFFGTCFTLENIRQLISQPGEEYFWAINMIIVKNLEKDTIRKTIKSIIENGYLEVILSEIGNIKDLFHETRFENIIDMA